MINNKKNLPVYIFFAIVSFCKGLGLDGTSKIYTFSYIIGSIFVLVKMFSDKYKRSEIVMLLIFLFIGLVNFVLGDTTTVLFSAICLCGMKNINIKKVLKIMFWTKLISFLLLVGLSSTGIIDNDSILHYREGVGFVKRFMFGFPHPNTAHISLLIIIFLYMYLYRPKNIVLVSIFITILNYIIYKYTLSRTSFIIIELYLFTYFFVNYFAFIKKVFMKIAKHSFAIFLALTIVISLLYDKVSFLQNTGTLLGRFNYNNFLLKSYSIPLFGSSMYNNYAIIDNSYISILYEGGFLLTIYMLFLMNKLLKKMYRNENIHELIIIFFVCMIAMIEGFFMNAAMNFTLLFLSLIIFSKKEDGSYDFKK